MGSAVPSRVSLLTLILRLNRELTYGIPPKFRGSVHLFMQTAILHQVGPESMGSNIAYRWRSLPRVRRQRASKPQGSPKRVLPWQVTMDQRIRASLSHTHYRYEVGMMKVPALSTTDDSRYIYCCVCFLCFLCFFPFILDIKFVGRTSRGHTGGRSHRIAHSPSFCGACLNFSRQKDSAIPFTRRP